MPAAAAAPQKATQCHSSPSSSQSHHCPATHRKCCCKIASTSAATSCARHISCGSSCNDTLSLAHHQTAQPALACAKCLVCSRALSLHVQLYKARACMYTMLGSITPSALLTCCKMQTLPVQQLHGCLEVHTTWTAGYGGQSFSTRQHRPSNSCKRTQRHLSAAPHCQTLAAVHKHLQARLPLCMPVLQPNSAAEGMPQVWRHTRTNWRLC